MAEQPEIKAIINVTNEHLDLLYKQWSNMFDQTVLVELMHKLQERVGNFYKDILTESDEREQAMKDDIQSLIEEIAEVTRLLHRNVYVGERPQDMPLEVWYERLDKSIEHLREELRERRAEICELLLQQEQLCDELGELPLPLLADPLPKPVEMSSFVEHLERLRAERMRRMEELFQLRSQIKQDMKVLELVPETPTDERLLSQANQQLTPDIIEKLRFMKTEYAAQVAELRERIDEMREKINVLWERLQESDEFAMRKVRSAKEYTQRTYDVLKEELQRCEELRRQNLKSFIEKLRVEITKWWDLTLKSEQERKRFSNFYNEWYNEDLLELHELELDDLKSFYNTNKEIYELFASRAEFWTRMEALESKANDPNRFNNRGGQLLKEERERKAISTKLPKIEQQITELVKAYEQRTNSSFLVHGTNILDHMANDWVRLQQAKEQQSSARKQTATAQSGNGKMLPPPTPGSTAPRTPMGLRNMSAMSASTMSLRKTPSNWQLSSMSGQIAKSTGNLHKRKLIHADNIKTSQTPNAKRSLMNTLNPLKTAMTLRKPLTASQQKLAKTPTKKVRVLESRLRRSSGLGRRSVGQNAKKMRSKLPKPEIRIFPPSGEDSDGFVTDTNDENVGTEAGPEDICNYNKFAPPVRSSELPRVLNAVRNNIQLPEPRRSKMWQSKRN